ncbi:hypothetical protein M407DRAFT_104928 [Tulasnella calospora MUT 4182]|uniref:Uncharacterized protein n=1 Tax=Tulasnella calospora MUT 4182 TaxID=1051891 RepID=A0A0C3LEV8_9AGAM|nr:hypothetical protein M407DRAFT_104928 [Tulasnella calospora MUT 4182]
MSKKRLTSICEIDRWERKLKTAKREGTVKKRQRKKCNRIDTGKNVKEDFNRGRRGRGRNREERIRRGCKNSDEGRLCRDHNGGVIR